MTTQAPTPGPLTAEDWASLADLHTLKGWLHGVSLTPDWNDVVADGGVTVAMVVQQEAGQMASRVGRVIDNFRLAPTAPVEASGSERDVVAAAAWNAARAIGLADGEDDAGPWPPTAGQFGWQEDDSEACRNVELAKADAAIAALRPQPSGSDRWTEDMERERREADYERGFRDGQNSRPQPSGETREAVIETILIFPETSDLNAQQAEDLADRIIALLSARPLALGGQQGEELYRVGEFIGNRPVLCQHGNIDPNNLCAYCEGEEAYTGRSDTTPARAEAQDEGAADVTALFLAWLKEYRRGGPKPTRLESYRAGFEASRAHPSPTPAADADTVRGAVEALLPVARANTRIGKAGDGLRAALDIVEAALKSTAAKQGGEL